MDSFICRYPRVLVQSHYNEAGLLPSCIQLETSRGPLLPDDDNVTVESLNFPPTDDFHVIVRVGKKMIVNLIDGVHLYPLDLEDSVSIGVIRHLAKVRSSCAVVLTVRFAFNPLRVRGNFR